MRNAIAVACGDLYGCAVSKTDRVACASLRSIKSAARASRWIIPSVCAFAQCGDRHKAARFRKRSSSARLRPGDRRGSFLANSRQILPDTKFSLETGLAKITLLMSCIGHDETAIRDSYRGYGAPAARRILCRTPGCAGQGAGARRLHYAIGVSGWERSRRLLLVRELRTKRRRKGLTRGKRGACPGSSSTGRTRHCRPGWRYQCNGRLTRP